MVTKDVKERIIAKERVEMAYDEWKRSFEATARLQKRWMEFLNKAIELGAV